MEVVNLVGAVVLLVVTLVNFKRRSWKLGVLLACGWAAMAVLTYVQYRVGLHLW